MANPRWEWAGPNPVIGLPWQSPKINIIIALQSE